MCATLTAEKRISARGTRIASCVMPPPFFHAWPRIRLRMISGRSLASYCGGFPRLSVLPECNQHVNQRNDVKPRVPQSQPGFTTGHSAGAQEAAKGAGWRSRKIRQDTPAKKA